ncbi:MAG TPA: recombinase family protein [Pseudolabrys sp.]|nr:recombinase family protein [Pseudolabrys sp.]
MTPKTRGCSDNVVFTISVPCFVPCKVPCSVAPGLIETVIKKDPAWLTRDSGQLLALLLDFRKAGVRVEYTGEEQSDSFLETVLCAVAEVEIATMRSKQTKR